MTPESLRLYAAIALAMITLALFGLIDRYDLVQPQILRNADFSDHFAHWTVSGRTERTADAHGSLHIEGKGKGHVSGVRQVVPRPEGAEVLRLTANVRYAGVTEGPRIWQSMRLLMVQRDAAGKALWELPHVAAQEHGDSPWRQVALTARLPQRVKAVEVFAVLNHVAGSMDVRDLKLDVVEESNLFLVLRYALTAAWAISLPWLAWPLLRAGPRRLGRAAVALMATVILIGVLTPHTAKLELRRIAQELTRPDPKPAAVETQKPAAVKKAEVKPAPKTARPSPIPISEYWRIAHKSGHVSLFLALALLAALTWREAVWWRLGLYPAVFALATEILQLLSLDRSAHVTDAVLNLAGVTAGLAAGIAFNRYLRTSSTDPDPPTT